MIVDIEDRLKAKCQKCGLRKQLRRCPVDGKLNCSTYAATLIRAYIRTASDDDLRKIPWELYAKGLQAYDMTGNLKQTKYVTI